MLVRGSLSLLAGRKDCLAQARGLASKPSMSLFAWNGKRSLQGEIAKVRKKKTSLIRNLFLCFHYNCSQFLI